MQKKVNMDIKHLVCGTKCKQHTHQAHPVYIIYIKYNNTNN